MPLPYHPPGLWASPALRLFVDGGRRRHHRRPPPVRGAPAAVRLGSRGDRRLPELPRPGVRPGHEYHPLDLGLPEVGRGRTPRGQGSRRQQLLHLPGGQRATLHQLPRWLRLGRRIQFSDRTRVDCLVCHDSTGTYRKFPTLAGHVATEPKTFEGEVWQPPDLNLIARSVAKPSRDTCGACHSRLRLFRLDATVRPRPTARSRLEPPGPQAGEGVGRDLARTIHQSSTAAGDAPHPDPLEAVQVGKGQGVAGVELDRPLGPLGEAGWTGVPSCSRNGDRTTPMGRKVNRRGPRPFSGSGTGSGSGPGSGAISTPSR